MEENETKNNLIEKIKLIDNEIMLSFLESIIEDTFNDYFSTLNEARLSS